MNNQQKQVIDNTSLVSFIGSRPVWPEGQTGFGRTGYGKVGYGSPNWAGATSKPFGKTRPGEVGGTCSNMPDCKGPVARLHNPVRSLRNIKPHQYVRFDGPEDITVADLKGFDPDAWGVKVAKKATANALMLSEFVKDKVISKAEPSKEGVVVNRKERLFKPAIVGLDKVRKVRRETVPAWEREKQERSDLLLYWLTLRSLYRLIYGG